MQYSFDTFRVRARALLAQGVEPDAASWREDDLFSADDASSDVVDNAAPTLAVPPTFLALCRSVVLHRDPSRYALLYRLLWRLAREPLLRDDPLDTDMLAARRMAHAVHRDIHKMRAFVRFREVDDEAGRLHVAWFEPDHFIVEANAPWFSRRFAQMRWAILTPDRCASWDGAHLAFAPGATREDAPPADAGEQLWLTYYRHIFNPARLKVKMMEREMPRRYWKNLPEAALIAPLAAEAGARSARMLEAPAPVPLRKIPVVGPRPETLPALHEAMERCRECPIGAQATQAVPGRGPREARLMFVGEQPGDQEDLAGAPFVGPAGQLLRRAFDRVGIDPAAVFLTNAVRHFKFELRGRRRIHKTPSQREAAACAHWLEEEIALARPRALVALGATAARTLLGRDVAVTRERGAWHTRPDGLRVLVTLHPSALLRMPPHEQAGAFEAFAADLARADAEA
ncbi:UdgX family uracil-DNA binding protein [Ramlibacter sp.]|uniref:UdgX family uracil-DNA binding protein n=1 Tax=Ramlibacter sp. TaxID=1917967 RepID=UPI003D1004F5